jgi:OmpA-OmpF porin, OOP family
LYVTIWAVFNTAYAFNSLKDSGMVLPPDCPGVRLDIIETKPMKQRLVKVTADEMSSEIAKAGHATLYGILFDFNKAELKPESGPVLQEIGKLLQDKPELKLVVTGHTDAVGGFDFNRDLSQRRAAAVVTALATRYRVAAVRLIPFGASFSSPVAPNDTEEGRAKNRRVELVPF